MSTTSTPAASSPPPSPSPKSETPSKHLLIRRYVPTDHTSAVKLVAEGYAQRRSLANSRIFRHPYFYTVLLPLLAIVFAQYDIKENLGTVILLTSGIIMAVMSLVGRITDPLLDVARDITRGDFLENADYAFVAIYGEELIGVCSMQYVELADHSAKDPLNVANVVSPSTGKRKSKIASRNEKQHAILSSWAVLRRYRNVGMGSDLLGYILQVASQDRADSLLVQCSSLESRARKTLKSRGFSIVSVTPLPGNLGRLGIKTETWSINPIEWVGEHPDQAKD
ncbi:hypothetical protein V1508DRAFT_428418 [Lipomyces doorenjongii]|uniref:uncharacterized protein n=1 Tax=Lipomyces doorenjongii TaxID=383834 RepID=UPI0034CEBAE6